MKNERLSIFLAAFALLALLPPLAAQTPPTRIMPLGDSITDGFFFGATGSGGYRGTLATLLTNAGYAVDYVGTLTSSSGNLPDPDHEGHGGWQIDQVEANIADWFNSIAPPDIVLLHIGTNDFGAGNDTANSVNRFDALILKIATLQPYAHIIVTNLMARGEPVNTSIQSQFNPFVPGRVAAHAAAGRRVTFLDMRAACPLSDMPDQLHPNQAGYDKMAAAWLTAIQAITTPLGDHRPPGIARTTIPDSTHLVVTFSKPVEDAATALSNYAINGLTISAAVLDATTKRQVTLTTSPMASAADYTLTVSGVRDRTAAANLTAPGTMVGFVGPTLRGATNNIPEAATYTLLYSLDLPTSAFYNTTPPVFNIDNAEEVGPFTRVAYYLELQRAGQPLQYCWVSMDSFANNPVLLGIPHVGTGATFQQPVANMNVVSNVPGVVNGSGLSGGNLEFWPTDYATNNSAGIAGASSSTFDFGDQPKPGGHGSMQIHNSAAAQTLIALNSWGSVGGNLDLGIGNNPTGQPDWTFAANAAGFTIRTLKVFVKLADYLPENPLSLNVELPTGAGAVLTYTGSPLQLFIVQRSTNLTQWTDLANVSANSAGSVSYTDPNPPAGKAFYRLQRVNP